MFGLYGLPESRVKEFMNFNGQAPDREKNFVLNKMKVKCVQ
jgi:hypothetical protein